MVQFQPRQQNASSLCNHRLFFLAMFWCLSIAFGILFAFFNQRITISLMCIAPYCDVSIVALISVHILPLLLSAVAVYFQIPSILFPWIALKGLSLGFCLLGAILAYGSSGWIYLLLLSFSQVMTVITQMWLYIICLSEEHTLLRKCFFICIIAAVIAVCIELSAISVFH